MLVDTARGAPRTAQHRCRRPRQEPPANARMKAFRWLCRRVRQVGEGSWGAAADTLSSSANPTEAALDRNIELGVLIRDRSICFDLRRLFQIDRS
jgi:hypothetical protein